MDRTDKTIAVALITVWACGSLPILASAKDPASVKPPYIEVGDCWTYSAKGFFLHGWVDSFRECIQSILPARNLMFGLANIQPGGSQFDTTYSLTWGKRTSFDGRTFEPPFEMFHFPLHVGDSYKVNFKIRDTGRGEAAAWLTRGTVNVVGWESVAVPAGQYRAVKVTFAGTSELVGEGTTGHITITWWYAPAVDRYVMERYGDGRELRLSKVELNP